METKKRLIIYHSADYDGKFSRDIVQHYFNNSCDEIGWTHGDERIKIDSSYDEVYVVDLDWVDCPVDLYAHQKIINIDHHKTNSYFTTKTLYFDLEYYVKIGKGACELVWEFFHKDKPKPKALTLASRYDVGKHNNEVLNFQYGIRKFQNMNLFHAQENIDEIIEEGKIIRQYIDNDNQRYLKKAFYRDFEGYRAIVINKANTNSQIFDSADKDSYDIMLTCSYNGKIWTYSIYTDKENIDVSKIAQKYNGGGHKKAAGFRTEKFIFEE